MIRRRGLLAGASAMLVARGALPREETEGMSGEALLEHFRRRIHAALVSIDRKTVGRP